jgi:hypothetical protein
VDVPAAVDEFLRCVRYRFPSVKLDDRNGFCREEENKALPYSWVDEYSTLEQLSFNPKAAAVLHLNWQASGLKCIPCYSITDANDSLSKSSTGPGSKPTSPAASAATTSTSPRRSASAACSSTWPPW